MNEARARFAAGVLPTAHQLRAALRVARLIDPIGTAVSHARESYPHAPYCGTYRSEDLIVGEAVLLEAGLLRQEEEVLYPESGVQELALADDRDGVEALLSTLLWSTSPLWLIGATTDDGVADELIPDDQAAILEDLLDPDAREALLLQFGRRFNDAAQRRVGALAEEHVVARCAHDLRAAGHDDLAAKVRRVSLVSDQLGYDVTAPRLDGTTRRLECKGATGIGPFVRFYLSRNEAERASRDAHWALVACRVNQDETVETVGWLAWDEISPFLPSDPAETGRWESARVEVPIETFTDGLPPK